MKALVILIILGGLGLVALYYFGGFSSLDPGVQGEQFRNSVHEGMTWEQVADLQEPRKFYNFDPESMTGRGADQEFSRDGLRDIISKGHMPAGFAFEYMFNADHAYGVHFDGAGNVTGVEKLKTTKDLFTLPSGQ